MQPLTDTAEAVSSAESAIRIFRTRLMFTPKVTAELSPIIMAFRGIASKYSSTAEPASTIRGNSTSLPSAPLRPPSIQKVAWRTAASWGAVYTR